MKEILPDEYSILIHGPPGVGKREFCIDLAKYFLSIYCTVVYMTTERSYKNIEERARSMGVELNGDRLFYIDYASWSTATTSGWLEDRKTVLTLQNPHNLKDIPMGIKTISHTAPGRLRVLFDSLSPLFLYNESEKVVQFVQMLTSQVKSSRGFIAYTLQEGVHSPSIVNALTYSLDGYLQLRFIEDETAIKKQLRIHHLQGLKVRSEWRDLEITNKGLKIAW